MYMREYVLYKHLLACMGHLSLSIFIVYIYIYIKMCMYMYMYAYIDLHMDTNLRLLHPFMPFLTGMYVYA